MIEKIEIYGDKIRIYYNDEVHQVTIVIEEYLGDFFDKLASAYYSKRAKAIPPVISI